MSGHDTLPGLLAEIRQCRLCQADLPLGPRPVLRAGVGARLMIVGQAPGTKVHETGVPWNDPSGDRLRQWMAVDRRRFYDESRVAIVPMGFCYPGRLPKGGDRPPRPECAATWHPRLLPRLPAVELILLAGAYAQKYFLAGQRKATLTETVRAWRDYRPRFLPLPHPSWRTTAWQRRNGWFDDEVLPELRRRVRALL
ncbi:MAG: uracil-DNA glycosylase family protein [Alphaproteobacteria bacterium]|jgi:uracil-DNA glycosylase|nr:uracil-DNA glycosylase family protein [Alphaproteobacteria bacterium]MDP6568149.1 uracil-DNA glycosylase family protein [Alphaproteobacteria bacterium]MDP6812841.1 uracil-DNA glycosylase family protein [Alphaproteobacteria bacterium]